MFLFFPPKAWTYWAGDMFVDCSSALNLMRSVGLPAVCDTVHGSPIRELAWSLLERFWSSMPESLQQGGIEPEKSGTRLPLFPLPKGQPCGKSGPRIGRTCGPLFPKVHGPLVPRQRLLHLVAVDPSVIVCGFGGKPNLISTKKLKSQDPIQPFSPHGRRIQPKPAALQLSHPVLEGAQHEGLRSGQTQKAQQGPGTVRVGTVPMAEKDQPKTEPTPSHPNPLKPRKQPPEQKKIDAKRFSARALPGLRPRLPVLGFQ